jgi:Alcohol dehydrogenase GroES-like domain
VEAASPKYSILYFLSEKGGSQNVWRRSFNGKDAPVQITKHEMHPVRFLSCSSGGDLVYGYDGEIWRLPNHELLIRMKHCGVCGSDVHLYQHGEVLRQRCSFVPSALCCAIAFIVCLARSKK